MNNKTTKPNIKKGKNSLKLPKGPYDPIQTEEEILKFWEDGKFFKPEYHRDRGLQKDLRNDDREPFCIINPPPNANARPHLGNMSGYAYQDLLGRYHRMLGKKTLLLPGKDHAGIQSEIVFEREVLKKQGKTKLDLEREEFYKQCYAYCTNCAKQARADEQRVGLSADFERDIFTLDPGIVEIVLGTFVELFEDKKIYKGIRINNWCPSCQTALSDADLERLERKSKLTYIRYALNKSEKSITIATTRPETMLADTAIAVNPKDKRYKDMVGMTAILPLLDREIPIITDPMVDKQFGTGALKVTPAHAYEDYEIMLRWNKENPNKEIGYINVIWKDSKLHGPVGKYNGMTVEEAQREVLQDLEKENLIEKTEEINQNVSICERCGGIIEPLVSSQWIVDVSDMRKKGLDAVKSRKVKLHPKYMENRYFQWMENLRDWPISRSLWWGYRIPAWYKGEIKQYIDDDGKVRELLNGKPLDYKNKNQVKVQLESPGEGWVQDDDVLDTWFSSGQWPYATLMKEELMDVFYPTNVMETGYGILELWVSRMIMLGEYKTGKLPFTDVFLHGTLLASDGTKMSKSKGNVISMDDVVVEHGADTLRLFFYVAGKAGSVYNFDWERIKFNRNFLNKIWNASKFVLMNLGDNLKLKIQSSKLHKEDKKQLEHMDDLVKTVTRHIENFKFNLAIDQLIASFWHTFCDQYLEYSKKYIYSDTRPGERDISFDDNSDMAVRYVLWKSLSIYLKLLHPFIPFITERLWREIPKEKEAAETIMYASWPTPSK
ncbi:MAG: valine--tRNA ligase [Candidatus Dojkabacteria bacterium]|nr:valine--tRNA ligase [Candidatus Dojkabacteria bacterium]